MKLRNFPLCRGHYHEYLSWYAEKLHLSQKLTFFSKMHNCFITATLHDTLNDRYPGKCIQSEDPITWPPRSTDLMTFDFLAVFCQKARVQDECTGLSDQLRSSHSSVNVKKITPKIMWHVWAEISYWLNMLYHRRSPVFWLQYVEWLTETDSSIPKWFSGHNLHIKGLHFSLNTHSENY
jgi:hypothetical protein